MGVDRDTGLRTALGKYAYKKAKQAHYITKDSPGDPDFGKDVDNIFVLEADTQVLVDKDGSPRVAVHPFLKGRGVYFSGYKFTSANVRLLHRAIYWASGNEGFIPWSSSNIHAECAYYPNHKKLVVINNSGIKQDTEIFDATNHGIQVTLQPHGIAILDR
jgi:beta-D-galactosyl-(1->4)-L-rhamnose phosphorylase